MSLKDFMHVQTVEVIITFCTSIAFIVLYSVLAPWWRSPLGRNLIAFDAVLSLTLLPSVIHHALGATSAEDTAFAWFTVSAFAAVPVVIGWRAVIMIRMQLDRKPDREMDR